VSRLCQGLNLSPSGYYAWRQRPVSRREMANRALMHKIEVAHRDSDETYGSPRVYQELKAQGVACSENRVARLMRLRGLRAKQSRSFKVTTRRNPADRVAPNILKRQFTVERLDQVWLADMTYILTGEGWLYLAAVLDLCSRRLVGWSMAARMTAELTETALKMALQQRQPAGGLIHHSDQGSQYTDQGYQALLAAHDIRVSMNAAGTWYDNAPMESFFGTLKSELVYHRWYVTRTQARTDVFRYIEAFYNHRRRHSALGYLSPAVYEELYHKYRLAA